DLLNAGTGGGDKGATGPRRSGRLRSERGTSRKEGELRSPEGQKSPSPPVPSVRLGVKLGDHGEQLAAGFELGHESVDGSQCVRRHIAAGEQDDQQFGPQAFYREGDL